MQRKTWLWVVSIVLVLVVGCSSGPTQGKQTSAEKNQTLKYAPDFILMDLDGKPFRLSALKGKVVILDFWATWCPPCRAEIPHFNALYEQYERDGLEIVGISLDRGGANTVKAFMENNEITYPILIGNQKVVEDYGGIRGIPTTFVIDREGRIVKKFVGYQDKATLESAIQSLL